MSADGFTCFHKTRISDELLNGSKQKLEHFDIEFKTAFLQGQSCGVDRDVVCQLQPEAGYPPYIAARMKKPAYDMNDASRRWWNILDKALCSYGMVPTRADRCCCVLYSIQSRERTWKQNNSTQRHDTSNILTKPRVRTEDDAAFQKLLAPIAGSPATEKSVAGIINLFVDDHFETSGTEIEQRLLARLRKDFLINLFVDDLFGTGGTEMEQRV